MELGLEIKIDNEELQKVFVALDKIRDIIKEMTKDFRSVDKDVYGFQQIEKVMKELDK